MKIALSIALGLFLVSCSEDATVSSKEASSSSKSESIYASSNLKLSSERDSISYTLGFEMSKPFITDTVFSKLNKALHHHPRRGVRRERPLVDEYAAKLMLGRRSPKDRCETPRSRQRRVQVVHSHDGLVAPPPHAGRDAKG